MATQVQFRGGTTAQNNAFTGASKELTVDTDKDVVVVHDGTTAGGHPLMAEDGSNSALALGNAGTPALKFTGDSNTGIYSPGANQLAISTGGTGRLFVDASGNVSVASSAVSLSPKSFNIRSTSGAVASLSSADTTTGSADTGPILEFRAHNGSSEVGMGELRFAKENSTSGNNASYFSVATGVSGGGLNERLRITSAGLLGIGTSSPDAKLDIKGNSGTYPTQQILHSAIDTDGEWLRIGRTDTTNIRYHSIHAKHSGTSTTGFNYIQFKVHDPNISATGQNTVLHLDGLGRVGIGTTGPSELLHVAGAGATALVAASSGVGKISLTRGAVAFEAYTSTSDCYVGTTSATDFQLRANNAEAARIDTSGRLLVGTSSALGVSTSTPAALEIETSQVPLSVVRNSSDGTGPIIAFGKSRGTTSGSLTTVVDNDILGEFRFAGTDGTTRSSFGGSIQCRVDGTPGTNDMPGRLVFSTTADGASSPTERMTIKNDGTINFANVQTFADDAAAGSGGLVSGDVYKTSAGDLKIKA